MNFTAVAWENGLLQVYDCKGGWVRRRLWTSILQRKVMGSVTGKIETGGGVRSNQVKRLGYIKCFNIRWKVSTNRLLTVLFYEAKNCRVVSFFYIKVGWSEEFSRPAFQSMASKKACFHFRQNELICSHLQNIWDGLWFSREIAHYWKSLICVFEEFVATIKKIFTLAMRLGTKL